MELKSYIYGEKLKIYLAFIGIALNMIALDVFEVLDRFSSFFF